MTSTVSAPPAQQEIFGLVRGFVEAWAAGDADGLVRAYSEDATVVLPGGTYLKGREAIRAAMTAQFQGKWKGTNVLGVPQEVRPVGTDVVLMYSQGGAYRPGSTEVAEQDAITALWVFAKGEAGWSVVAYENTPLGRPVPLPKG
jgi:uncharacterized protein (TIGR02246 family)